MVLIRVKNGNDVVVDEDEESAEDDADADDADADADDADADADDAALVVVVAQCSLGNLRSILRLCNSNNKLKIIDFYFRHFG